jgi:hypothetical protein
LFTACGAGAPLRPSRNQIQGLGRFAVVVPVQSTFTFLNARMNPSDIGPMPAPIGILDAMVILGLYLVIAGVVAGTAAAADAADTAAVASHAAAISAPSVLGEAFVNALRASGCFGEIRMLDREPEGDELKRFDAVVLLKVPTWGLVSVPRKEQKQVLMSGFATFQARMTMASGSQVV